MNLLNSIFNNLSFDLDLQIDKDRLLELNDDEETDNEEEDDDENKLENNKKLYKLNDLVNFYLNQNIINNYNSNVDLISNDKNSYTYTVGLKESNEIYINPINSVYGGKGRGLFDLSKDINNQINSINRGN